MDNSLLAQVPFLVLIIFLAIRIIVSLKRGFVKELCGLVAIIFAAAIILLLSVGFSQYFGDYKLMAWASVVLVVLLLVVYRLLDLVLTTLKIFAKLPGVSTIDKILGPVFAVAETIVFVWGVYCVTMVMNQGLLHDIILASVRSNPVMRLLYQYNYLYVVISQFSGQFSDTFAKVITQIDPNYK